MSSLNELIQKLAGAKTVAEATTPTAVDEHNQITDPVYVEKLASAVDFIVEGYGGESVREKTASAVTKEPVVTSVSDISGRLRTSLKEKLAERSSEAEADSPLIQNVLSKLKELREERMTQVTGEELNIDGHDFLFPEDETGEEVAEVSTEHDSHVAVEETPDSDEEGEDVVLKAASVEDFNLEDVMNAALSNTDEPGESASSGSTETGGVRGSNGPMARVEATQRLREKLMAKVRGTEV